MADRRVGVEGTDRKVGVEGTDRGGGVEERGGREGERQVGRGEE